MTTHESPLSRALRFGFRPIGTWRMWAINAGVLLVVIGVLIGGLLFHSWWLALRMWVVACAANAIPVAWNTWRRRGAPRRSA